MSKKLTPAQKAVITKNKAKSAAAKKAASLTPAQKAWITIRARQAAVKPVATKKPVIKPVTIKKPVKVVKGLIKDGPPTAAEIRGQFNAVPVYKTVEELLSEPSRWTQGVEATDKNGNDVDMSDSSAARFCLSGAISRVYGRETDKAMDAEEKLEQVILAYTDGLYGNVVDFNDDSDTTYTDVARVVRLAKV